jgi:UDP-galactopyranose mutase
MVIIEVWMSSSAAKIPTNHYLVHDGWLPYNNLDNQFCRSLIQHFQCVLVLNHATLSETYFRNRSHVVLAIIQAMLNSIVFLSSNPRGTSPRLF